jgi:hypothetical protein
MTCKLSQFIPAALQWAVIGLLLSGWGISPAFARHAEDTLLVWAGDQARKAPDFIAVIDFDRASPHYGKILRTVPLPLLSPHEPHHLGVSQDGRTLALGGLLSILTDGNQVFFFDVTDRRRPAFIKSDNPPGASITDEFDAPSSGGFLATFMGDMHGHHPGRVVEYNARLNFVAAWPAEASLPNDGFNPHGIAIDEAHNLMVTSDFICPLLTLNVPGGDMVDVRGSVRVWDLAHRAILRTIPVGDPANPAGTIDIKLIPHDRRLRAFTAGMTDDRLYLVDTQKGTAQAVFDFAVFSVPGAPIWPQLLRINRAGTRLFVTLNYAGKAGKVVLFDIARPERPKVLSVADLGPGSGPHYLRLTKDEKRLVVSDYFLVEDLAPGGVVHAEGDHKIHVLNVNGNSLEPDERFDVDFNRDIATGPARPHGLALLPAGER